MAGKLGGVRRQVKTPARRAAPCRTGAVRRMAPPDPGRRIPQFGNISRSFSFQNLPVEVRGMASMIS